MLYWIPALVWMGVIFYLSARTGDELHSLFPFCENFNPGHVAAYFMLSALFYLALYKNGRHRAHFKSMVLCLIYSISDELHQHFVPTRYPDLYDLARDLTGAGLAMGTVFLVENCLRRRTRGTG